MIIAHRVNTRSELARIPSVFGVEVDIRDHGGRLILQHGPQGEGEVFEEYLSHYRHRFLILNIKCEGIEDEVLSLMARNAIREFFLLDLSFPALVRLARKGERRIAVRLSEFEPVEGCLALEGRVDWIWVDCFTRYPSLGHRRTRLLSRFKTCLVAPELQGHLPYPTSVARHYARFYGASAVCTKRPQDWAAILGDGIPGNRIPRPDMEIHSQDG